jgi:hypothetical protein
VIVWERPEDHKKYNEHSSRMGSWQGKVLCGVVRFWGGMLTVNQNEL